MDKKRGFWTGIAILGIAAGILVTPSGLALAQTPGPVADPTADMLTVVAGFSGGVVSQNETPAALPGNVVGPAGGRITSPSGRLVLDVPPGALLVNTEITITEQEPDEGPTVGPTFDLRPDGLTFAVPATLLIRYTPADVPEGYGIEDVAIVKVAPSGEGQMDLYGDMAEDEALVIPFLDTTVDPQAGTASITIDHFSRYGARAYSTYTLGDPQHGKLGGIFDFGGKGDATDGMAASFVGYNLLGTIDMAVAVPVGEHGTASAGAVLTKWFRVKAGSQGEISVDDGLVGVKIEHSGLLGNDSNDYSVIIGVQCIDSQKEGMETFIGAPQLVSSGPSAGQFIATGQFAQRYYKDPWGMGTDPPYSAGTLDVVFRNCEFVADDWYAFSVTLMASALGFPPSEHGHPAAGGSVEFITARGPFIVTESYVEG